MKALITGGCGFAGRYLAQHLVACGDDVAVTYHPKNKEEEQKDIIPLPKSVQTFALDITEESSVSNLLKVLQPDAIYHLAALTFVPDAEKDFLQVFEVNTYGTEYLLRAVTQHAKDVRFLYVSSAEVYGDPKPGSLPITEQAVLRPVTVYGVAKAAADLIAYKYFFRENVNIIRVRPFPHVGPGQHERFALSGFAKQVAEIKLGKIEPKIRVGNLEAKRDFSDVSDIVRGYREALLNGKRGEAYNLCSGVSISVGEALQKLIQIAQVEAEVVVDEARLRSVEVTDIYGSAQRALKDFGWKPRINIDQTLHSLFAHWLERLGSPRS